MAGEATQLTTKELWGGKISPFLCPSKDYELRASTKQILCRYWVRGFCKYNTGCFFAHSV